MRKEKQNKTKKVQASRIKNVTDGRRFYHAPNNKTTKNKTAEKVAKKKPKLRGILMLCATFFVLLMVLVLLKQSAAVSEFMTSKVSRGIITGMGKFSGLFPFSLFEVFLYIVAIAAIVGLVAIIIFLIKKKFAKSLQIMISFILIALVFGNIYFVSAGFAYNRYQQYFPTQNPALDKQQTVEVAEYFVDDYNAVAQQLNRTKSGEVIMPYSISQLSKKLQEEYKRLDGYNINSYTSRCKPIFSSRIMSEMRLAGVFFAPLGEANMNSNMPAIEMPFVMAHEMAHAKGIMRENDANNVALYITLTSSDPFIRYSAYKSRIYTLLDAVSVWESGEAGFEIVLDEQSKNSSDGLESDTQPELDYFRLIEKINPIINKDNVLANDYWRQFHRLSNFLGDITNTLNNIYLNIMGQEEGTEAYLPPTTIIVEQPKIDEQGNTVLDPDGQPVIITRPQFNTVQQIFIQAYSEKNGQFLQK